MIMLTTEVTAMMFSYVSRFKFVSFAFFAALLCWHAPDATAVEVPAGWSTIYVASDGDDANDGSTWNSAKASVADALADASSGNVFIEVGEGTFYENATLVPPANVWIVGQGADKTTLHFGGNVRGVEMSHSSSLLASLCIRGGKATGKGGGASISAGEMRDCRITSCWTTDYNGHGGGVYMTGGSLSGCEIDNCQATMLYSHGNGIYIANGTVTNCNIHANDGGYSHDNPLFGSAGGVYIEGGTLVASRIHHNSKATIAGINQVGGTVANCLVYGNSGTVYGAAGLRKTAGNTYNCTFYRNRRSSDTEGNSGLEQSGGTTINCIFSENYPGGNLLGGVKVTGGSFKTNIVDIAPSYGGAVGVIAANPRLRDPENGDFHPIMGSPAIGNGAPLPGLTADFEGTPRGAAPSIGALEYVSAGGPLTAAIMTSADKIPVGGSVTWTAAVEGSNLNGLTYEWYLDGASLVMCTGDVFVFDQLDAGTHVASLIVRNAAGETAQASLATPILVSPVTVYVSNDGAGVWPYDAPAKATNDIVEAYAALWLSPSTTGTINVASGTYQCRDQLLLQNPMRIVGQGASETILDFNHAHRGLQLVSGAARVEALCVRRGCVAASGAGLYLSAGEVRNCRITECYTSPAWGEAGHGGGVYMTGGTLSGCEIDNCQTPTLYNHGNGIWMSGGTVTNCDIHANNGGYSHEVIDYGSAGGVYMTGGRIVDSRIHHNYKASVAGLELRDGTVENCSIYSNGDTTYGCPGVHKVGGTLRNSLVGGNSGTESVAGVYQTAGTLSFCTIAANVGAKDADGRSGLSMEGGTAVGNIIWGNGPGDPPAGGCRVAGGTFEYNLTAAAVAMGTGNIVGNPFFRNFADGDYHLRRSSPCLGQGPVQSWMASAVDLDGNPRINRNHPPDLGCYELGDAGSTMIILR